MFRENGAQGRDRTTDTAIFSRMLYQLSYLGISLAHGGWERGFIVRPGSAVYHASPSASRGAAMQKPKAERARRSPKGEDGLARNTR